MALVVRDRVKETTTTTGTGTLTLAGAMSGFQAFSVIGNANTTYYAIYEPSGTAWEVGIGTYTLSGATLSRNTILASSNAGAAVNFGAGTKVVFCTYPAGKSVYLDASGNAIGLGTPAAFVATNVTGLPISTGVSGLGTGVATALAVNTGTAGAFVVNGGALGTPSSGTVTNLTGTASININGTVGATTPTTGAFTTISATGVVTVSAGAVGAPSIISTTGTSDTGQWFPAADTIAWSTAGSERMRINSLGNLILGGTTQAGANSRISLYFAGGGTQYGMEFKPAADDTYAILFLNASSGTVGSITNTSTTTAYNTSSDYRLKENVTPMQNALTIVAKLNPVNWKWKSNGSAGQGFIAHELQEIIPECVTGKKDAVDVHGKPIYQGVDTSFLVATLTAAIQELKAELDTVKAKLDTK